MCNIMKLAIFSFALIGMFGKCGRAYCEPHRIFEPYRTPEFYRTPAPYHPPELYRPPRISSSGPAWLLEGFTVEKVKQETTPSFTNVWAHYAHYMPVLLSDQSGHRAWIDGMNGCVSVVIIPWQMPRQTYIVKHQSAFRKIKDIRWDGNRLHLSCIMEAPYVLAPDARTYPLREVTIVLFDGVPRVNTVW
jgi:hypothetical protein